MSDQIELLTQINGIGKSKAQTLIDDGVDTLEKLIQSDSSLVNDGMRIQAKVILSKDKPIVSEIKLDLLSGDHKGKSFVWGVGNPSMMMAKTGRYVGLSSISLASIDNENGITKFKLTWGQSVSGGQLPTNEFDIISEHVKKIAPPAYENVHVVQNSGVMGRVVNGAKQFAYNALGGCRSCGQ